MSEANVAVESVLIEEQSGGNNQKKRKYTHYTPQQRAKIAKVHEKSTETSKRMLIKFVSIGSYIFT